MQTSSRRSRGKKPSTASANSFRFAIEKLRQLQNYGEGNSSFTSHCSLSTHQQVFLNLNKSFPTRQQTNFQKKNNHFLSLSLSFSFLTRVHVQSTILFPCLPLSTGGIFLLFLSLSYGFRAVVSFSFLPSVPISCKEFTFPALKITPLARCSQLCGSRVLEQALIVLVLIATDRFETVQLWLFANFRLWLPFDPRLEQNRGH